MQKVTPDSEHPTGGAVCVKGLAAPEIIDNEERLKYPLKRTSPKGAADPGWVRISWDEAFKLASAKITEIKGKYGAEAIAFYRTARGTGASSEYWAFVNRLANCLGSPNVLCTSYVCQWGRDNASVYTYGNRAPAPDLDKTAGVLLWGANLSDTWNTLYRVIKKVQKRGGKIIAIDPRRTDLAKGADLWLQVRPGADLALALSIMHVMVKKDLYDHEFVKNWTNAPFLVRQDNGKLLRLGNIANEGNSDDLLAWDETEQCYLVYDPTCRAFTAKVAGGWIIPINGNKVNPALHGTWTVQSVDQQEIALRPVWEELCTILKRHNPEEMLKLTGVPVDAVEEAATLLGTVKPFSYFTYNGVEQHVTATQFSRSMGILYSLTGNLEQEGGNLWFPKIPVNDLSGATYLSAEQDAKRLGLKERPLGPPAVAASLLPGLPPTVAAHDLYTAILEETPYPVKALLSFGGNLISAYPDSLRGREALQGLDFYLHTDLFLNPAAQQADLVLPACTPWESKFVKTGFNFVSRRALSWSQLRHQVIEPRYETRSDISIIFGLAHELGLAENFWHGDLDKALAYHLEPSGISLEQLRDHPEGLPYPYILAFKNYAKTDPHTGFPVGFNTPSGRIEIYSSMLEAHGFSPIPGEDDLLLSDPLGAWEKDFPYLLITTKQREFCHSMYRSVPSLRRRMPHPFVEIHPVAANSEGIKDGEWVWLETPKGRIKLMAKLTDTVLPQVLCTQHGWWQFCPELNLPGYDPYGEGGANINLIIGTDFLDKISGAPPLKSYRCRVHKIK